MIRTRLHLLALATGLLMAACASRVDEQTAQGSAPAQTPKEDYKKPVRMNGRGEVSSILLDDFFALHQSGRTLVFDARPALFHQFGHIPGAVSLPKHDCDATIAKMEKDIRQAVADGKTIVVYCTGLLCPDARTVARHISGFGYPASIFSGGWDAWKEADLPVE